MGLIRAWVRWDPVTDEAVLEDEAGEEISGLELQHDAGFTLIGPLELEDGK